MNKPFNRKTVGNREGGNQKNILGGLSDRQRADGRADGGQMADGGRTDGRRHIMDTFRFSLPTWDGRSQLMTHPHIYIYIYVYMYQYVIHLYTYVDKFF